MLIIPTKPLASQTLTATVAGQPTRLNIYQLNQYGLYMDVLLNDAPIIQGVVCQNANRIIRDAYFGYVGDFAWFDSQGLSDPYYAGLGSRWFLAYLAVADTGIGT